MFFLIPNSQTRPTLLSDDKNEKYHLDFARYCVGQANNQLQVSFIEKVKLNKNFYKGEQWILHEDTEIFLKDDQNQDRNRLKIIRNQIRPMVEQYRGNAIRMNINYRVKSISQQAVNRRETQLAKMLHLTKVANQPDNPFGEEMKKMYPIGNSEAETVERFNNNYVDKYVKKMNYLLKFISERNEFEDMQVSVAENLALSGLGVMKGYEYGGHHNFTVTQSENFFFDRSARKYNLSDAEFMGEVMFLSASEIFEIYPDLSYDDKLAIENAIRLMNEGSRANNGDVNNMYSNKLPVYIVYWKDGESYEYGYVKDKFGYEFLTKINYVFEGEDKPRYTDKDLVESKSIRGRRLLKGKKKRKLFVDTLRVCHFIPGEIVPSGNGDKGIDILLEWGIPPYQETENLDMNNVQFPYKCYCWGYVDGEIMSPIDDAISPQRFINRILSVAENQINNSRGSGTAIDSSVVTDESEVLRAMNKSEPIFLEAKGKGMQNVVTTYDTSVKNGTLVLFNIIDTMQNYLQSTTGVNEALKGESTGSDQLVGVTQLMIQRGSLMQEPFYNGITQIFKQSYQAAATTGKKIYCDNERNIAIAVGDEGTEIIRITKDMKLEDFRCFIKRENPDEILVNSGNQMLTAFLQMGIVDQKQFASLYNRSTPDEIASAIRENAKQKEEIAVMQAREQQKQMAQIEQGMQQQQAVQEQMMFQQEAREDVRYLDEKKHDQKKEYIKQLGKIAPFNQKAQNQIVDATKNLDQ